MFADEEVMDVEVDNLRSTIFHLRDAVQADAHRAEVRSCSYARWSQFANKNS